MKEISGQVSVKGRISGALTPRGNVSGSVGRAEKVYENDYNNLKNKPQIEGVPLENDKTFEELGLTPISAEELADMWNDN
ncbi:MAG: hypothetical protein IKR76_07315 [Ruminococcus sp.]|nr:hypothetical protein [Ruminococcus sp.]